MRVIHFILDHRVGGPHVYYATLKRALPDSVTTVLATGGSGPMTEIALLNLRQFGRGLYPVEVICNTILIALRYGFRHRPALFHVHGAANLAPILAAVFVRLPVVWQWHETLPAHARLAHLCSWMLRLTRHSVLSVADVRPGLFGNDHPDIVPGLVDSHFWAPPDAGLPTTAPSFGSPLRLIVVANLNPLKGVDVLLAALEHINHPIALRIVGSRLHTQSTHAEELERMAAALRCSRPMHSIEFLGRKSASEVRGELAQSDVFVLPSRSEACPIALLEAMAMALPCAATDVGSVRSMLPAEQCEFVCPPENPKALAHAVQRLADLDPVARRSMGMKNRAAAISSHSPAEIARRILAHYRRLGPHGHRASAPTTDPSH